MALQLNGLRIGLRSASSADQAPLVDDLSLTIAEGGITALVGESGSGKSLTALSMMGLLTSWNAGDTFVVAGDLTVGDTVIDLATATDRHFDRIRGSEVSMIFQDPWSALNPVRAIGRQVSDAVRAHRPMTMPAARNHAIELLDRVGIPEPHIRVGHYPHQLSGGQLQRVMIAMALAGQPSYLIADEPTTALDVTVQAEILALLEDLTAEGLGILLITHDLSVVARYARSVLVMLGGTVLEQGPTESVISEPRHPYTKLLISSVPTLAVSPGSRLVTKADVIADRVADPHLKRFSNLPGDDPPQRIQISEDHWISSRFTRSERTEAEPGTELR